MSEYTHAGFCVRTTWQQCAGLVRPLETLQTQGLSCHIARPLQKVKSFCAGRVPTESTQHTRRGERRCGNECGYNWASREKQATAPNEHKERAPNPGAHPAQFMSGFVEGS